VNLFRLSGRILIFVTHIARSHSRFLDLCRVRTSATIRAETTSGPQGYRLQRNGVTYRARRHRGGGCCLARCLENPRRGRHVLRRASTHLRWPFRQEMKSGVRPRECAASRLIEGDEARRDVMLAWHVRRRVEGRCRRVVGSLSLLRVRGSWR
jgi:hypothetical protein